MAIESGEPDSGLVAEGYRQRVLQMCAPRHRCVAIPLGKLGEVAADCRQIPFEQHEASADLQHHGRIHDVLGRGSPMNVAAVVPRPFGELAHERQDRIPDGLRFLLQAREIECVPPVRERARRPRNCVARFGRDDPEPSLRAGERRLDVDAAGKERFVTEDSSHRRGAEHVGKNCGIEDSNRHYRANAIQPPLSRRSSAGKRCL